MTLKDCGTDISLYKSIIQVLVLSLVERDVEHHGGNFVRAGARGVTSVLEKRALRLAETDCSVVREV